MSISKTGQTNVVATAVLFFLAFSSRNGLLTSGKKNLSPPPKHTSSQNLIFHWYKLNLYNKGDLRDTAVSTGLGVK